MNESETLFCKNRKILKCLSYTRKYKDGRTAYKGHSARCLMFTTRVKEKKAKKEEIKQPKKGNYKWLVKTKRGWQYFLTRLEDCMDDEIYPNSLIIDKYIRQIMGNFLRKKGLRNIKKQNHQDIQEIIDKIIDESIDYEKRYYSIKRKRIIFSKKRKYPYPCNGVSGKDLFFHDYEDPPQEKEIEDESFLYKTKVISTYMVETIKQLRKQYKEKQLKANYCNVCLFFNYQNALEQCPLCEEYFHIYCTDDSFKKGGKCFNCLVGKNPEIKYLYFDKCKICKSRNDIYYFCKACVKRAKKDCVEILNGSINE